MERWLWKPEFHIPVENLLDPTCDLGKRPVAFANPGSSLQIDGAAPDKHFGLFWL